MTTSARPMRHATVIELWLADLLHALWAVVAVVVLTGALALCTPEGMAFARAMVRP